MLFREPLNQSPLFPEEVDVALKCDSAKEVCKSSIAPGVLVG
jgi:hypothetical protein